MSRRIRHVHANDDEWVVVHRNRPSGGGGDNGCGCIIAIIILVALLGGC